MTTDEKSIRRNEHLMTLLDLRAVFASSEEDITTSDVVRVINEHIVDASPDRCERCTVEINELSGPLERTRFGQWVCGQCFAAWGHVHQPQTSDRNAQCDQCGAVGRRP